MSSALIVAATQPLHAAGSSCSSRSFLSGPIPEKQCPSEPPLPYSFSHCLLDPRDDSLPPSLWSLDS